MAEQPVSHRGFEIAGIPIRINVSWLPIFALVLWTLSARYLPSRLPDIEPQRAWLAGLVATAGFFASIVFHELAHALVARRAGLPVKGITLFLFGGVSQIEEEPRDPKVEMRMAAVGPLASFVLAGAFLTTARSLASEPPSVSQTVLEYLGWINLALGAFNLLPGFPLDGGRVLRALVWWRTGSLQRATRLASNLGKGFAVGLMLLGALQMIAGAWVGGVWLVFIGLFLRSMAAAGWEELVLRTALAGTDVASVMVRTPLTVSPDLSLRALVDERFVREGVRAYPVCEGDKVVGAISLDQLRAVPTESLSSTRVREVMVPFAAKLCIEPGDSLLVALRKMVLERLPLLVVMQGDRLAGVVTRSAVQRVMEVRRLIAAEPSQA